MNWQEKVEVYPGADAGAATLGTLAAAGAQLRTNTDVVWANQPLRVYANNDVIQSVKGPHGGLYRMVADADLTLWGGYGNEDALISLSRADVAGEPDAHIVELAATSDNWSFDGSVFIEANASSTGAAGNFNAQVLCSANNGTVATQVWNRVSCAEGAWIDILGFAAQTNAYLFRISDAGGVKTQFSPFVADGASAVAYMFDTSNALANIDAQLVSIRNNNSTVFSMSVTGGIMVGPNSLSSLGQQAVEDTVFFCAHDVALGDFDGTTISIKTSDGADDGSAILGCDSTSGGLALIGGGNSINVSCTTNPSLSITIALTQRTKLNPTVADGATAEAYIFDTSVALANAGARIVSFEISGTRKSSIDVNGAYFVGANQVVGARVVDARIDDAINSGDATTDGVIDACRDALIAHGLCTAA